MIIGKHNRLEDFGQIYTKMEDILHSGHFSNLWDYSQSKHSYEGFMERFADPEKLELLFDELKWLRSELDDIHCLAAGEPEGN